jgi:hypothetical protein
MLDRFIAEHCTANPGSMTLLVVFLRAFHGLYPAQKEINTRSVAVSALMAKGFPTKLTRGGLVIEGLSLISK